MAIGASQGNVIASAFVRIQPETSGFGPALRQTLATNLLQLEKQQEGFFNKIKGSVGTTAKLFATAGATSLSLFGAAAFASAKDLEKTSNAFKGLYGSVAEGKKQFDAVFKLAEVTPFEGSGLAKNFQKFVASYTSGGVDIKVASDRTMKIMQTLADGGSALGATSDNIDGFSLALTQMVGKGKLTGEEIRQMTNNLAGFNVRGAVATKMFGNSLPESVSKLDKAMKKGEVSADLAMEAILEGLNKIPGAAGAAARQLRTVSGAMSTIKDIFERSTFDGLEQPLKVLANTLVDNSEVFRSVFKTMAEELGGIVITMSGLMSEVMSSFDDSFGKLAIGGLRGAGGMLFGFQEGLIESLNYLGVLGQLMQDNNGYFVLLGQSLGNISVGFTKLFTHMVKGMEPAFKAGTMFFEMFSVGFRNVAEIFGPQIELGLRDMGMSFIGLLNSLKASFSELFDSSVANDFIRAVASVGRTLLELIIRPLDALSEKTDGLASGFEKIFKTWTPPLEDFKAAVLGLADAFSDVIAGVNMDVLSDFAAGTGKHVIEAFTALATYGAIFIDVVENLLGIMGPLNAVFGNFAEQAGAALIVFKLTNSPILALIALFKDLDTGLVVFFLTLSKVVPMIRQMQTALASVGTANIVNGLGGIVSGMRGIQTTAIPTLGAFTKAMRDAGKISDISYRQMMNNGMFKDIQGMNINDPKATARMASLVKNDGFLRNAKDARNLNVALSDVNRNLGKASFQSEYLGRVTTQAAQKSTSAMNTLHLGVRQVEFGYSDLRKTINSSSQAGVTWQKSAGGGMVAVARNAQQATQATGGAVAATGKLGIGLAGIGGLASSIGLGVGISLLTSHLASSAEQANKTKREISELADLSFNYLNAKTGTDRGQAVQEGVAGIQQRFGDNAKALGEFNSLLARNGVSTEQFYRDINKNEKTRTKTVGKLVKDLLTNLEEKSGGKDIFENSFGGTGGRNISKKQNDQALQFYMSLATVDGAQLERGLDANDKGIKEAILKRAGVTAKEYNSASKKEQDKIIKKAGADTLFSAGKNDSITAGLEGRVQFKGAYDDIVTVLGQISQAAGDGAYKQKQMNRALQDSETIAKSAADSYKLFGESQKTALASSSAFYDLLFEAKAGGALEASAKNTLGTARAVGFDASKLVQSKEGTEFLTPFSKFKESEDAIKTNVNAPVTQTIGLLKQSNEEIIKFGKNVGLSAEEIARVQIATGDLTYAEDLGEFVEQLSVAGKLGGGNLQAILREASAEGFNTEAFLASIPTKEARDTIEKGLKDIEGSILIDIDPTIFSNLTDSLERAGKGSALDVDFLNIIGNKSFAAKAAIQALFDSGIPILQGLNKQFNEGKISVEDWGTGISNTRTQLIDTLFQETQNMDQALKIYAEFGLMNEVSEIKLQVQTLIDGKKPEEAQKLMDAYLGKFSEKEYPLKLKAMFELSPEQAVNDFVSRAKDADQTNKNYAFKNVDAKTLAGVSKDQSAAFINLQVMPEIHPKARAAYVAELAQMNSGTAAEVFVHLDEKTAQAALAQMPSEKQIELFSHMNPMQLASSLALIPKESQLSILAGMDQSKLASALMQMPTQSRLDILTNLPEDQKAKILNEMKTLYPDVYARLSIEEQSRLNFMRIIAELGASTAVKIYATTDSKGGVVRRNANGGIFNKETLGIFGEAGAEAIIPMTRPTRALQLLKQSGLYDLALTHAQTNRNSSSIPYSTGSSASSTDRSVTNNIKVEMNNTRTTDPEGLALMLGSRLTNGIRR